MKETSVLWEETVQPGATWRHVLKRGTALRITDPAGGANVGAPFYNFECPVSTFILGKFGGHAGRAPRAGDVLHVGQRAVGGTDDVFFSSVMACPVDGSLTDDKTRLSVPPIPRYGSAWEIGVLYGPHGTPDFFTRAGVETFFSTAWTVHYNSDRTGVRLIGPKPQWAREDGGEAGLHPSNLHDNAYAVGTVDFTGDMPVILGPDGPGLGGFVCLATIAHAELWKLGQVKPGDNVSFRAISHERARALEVDPDTRVATLTGAQPELPETHREEPVLRHRPAFGGCPALALREDGDRCLLIEYGPNSLDRNLRFRAHALEGELRAERLPGILDITPGVRSLHIHCDGARLDRAGLLAALEACEARIPDLDDMAVPSRVVHLPLSWDDPATQLAIRKYMQSVRPDAPWCPSNIEFIRRINGLDSIDDVRRVVFHADYLVLGLGDVYLGAPVAAPVDPRHRLVTTKYNPARTWTPENAVGIGGAYLCVYGMEGPGGYQFVGRTLQMWNSYRATAEFEPGMPWLLRFFDRIRFFPMSAEELLEIREEFPHGRYPLRIELESLALRQYHAFLKSIEAEAASWQHSQQEAFEAERERWAVAGADRVPDIADTRVAPAEVDVAPEGCNPVCAPVTASVWNVAVEAGERVEAGQKLVVLEAMKMEFAVAAPHAGTVERLDCAPGLLVTAGQRLVTLRPELEP
jgi:urea carboxylase